MQEKIKINHTLASGKGHEICLSGKAVTPQSALNGYLRARFPDLYRKQV